MDESFDLLVIGAGPSGSTAARVAASKGIKVILIDQKRSPGIPVQCGELVSQWIFRYLPTFCNSIVQEIENIITHFPDGSSFKIKNPGFMINRSSFDKELLIYAALSGAKISMETKAVEYTSKGVVIQRHGKKELIKPKLIIGADGANSIISKWIEAPPLKKIHTIQIEVIMSEPSKDAHIFFDPLFEGGYAWLFPKGKTANIGVGVISKKSKILSALLNYFLEDLRSCGKIKKVEILYKTSGNIPCEIHEKTFFNDILLVGDAAGHAHPITGAGIMNAVLGGQIAGEIASKAIDKKDLNILKEYEEEWKKTFGKSIHYGVIKRKFLEENWNNPEMDFQSLIRSCWVGFKEYHLDRKGKNNGE